MRPAAKSAACSGSGSSALPIGRDASITRCVTDLLVERRARRAASAIVEPTATPRRSRAASRTLLATGGAGQVFRETTNPPVATGDGIALAYHAGARVADLEFVQFHPTALNVAGAPRFLHFRSAARRRRAARQRAAASAFMARYHPDGDLAPRDVVARAIVREAERTGRDRSS